MALAAPVLVSFSVPLFVPLSPQVNARKLGRQLGSNARHRMIDIAALELSSRAKQTGVRGHNGAGGSARLVNLLWPLCVHAGLTLHVARGPW